MRGRNRNGKGPNPMSRSYESNGPDVKIRGTASHIADKYVQLSRDAQSAGDPVSAQAYMQHAEHYYRLLALAQAQFQPNAVIVRADDEREEYEDDGSEHDGSDNGENGSEDNDAGAAPQPVAQDRDRDQNRDYQRPQGRDRFRGRDQGREREPYRGQETVPAPASAEIAPVTPPSDDTPADAEPAREPAPARGRGRPRSTPPVVVAPVDPSEQPQPRIERDAQPDLPAFITGAPARVETATADADADEGAARRGRRRRYGRAGRPEDGSDVGPSSADEAPASAE